MKLLACHVENFGKLSNLDMTFNDGINIINQPNGWGKSTLTAFFRAMLYGFDNKKEPGAFEKERKIYRPWQGGVYGGQLDFEIDGRQYRVVRVFGTTEKTDEFHLYDLKTNLESDDYSSKLGEEIFDIDRNSFRRSIFIAQNECACETSDAINAKLGNLAENTDDINNFESAQNKLRDLMNRMSPSRITGSIKKRKNTITELEQELRGYRAAEESMGELTRKLEEKYSQKAELQQIRQEYAKALKIASEDSRKRAAKHNYESLCEDETDKKRTCQIYQTMFPDKVPTEEELKEQLDKARKLETNRTTIQALQFDEEEEQRYEELEAIFEKNQPTDELIDEQLQKAANLSSVQGQHGQLELKLNQMETLALTAGGDNNMGEMSKKSHFVPAGIVLVVVGIIVSIASLVVSMQMANETIANTFLAIGALGLLFTVVGVVFIMLGAKKNRRNERERIRKLAELEQQQKEREEPIRELKAQLEQIENGLEELSQEVKQFLAEYGVKSQILDYQRNLYELKNKLHEYVRLLEKKQRLDLAKEQMEQLGKELTEFGSSMRMVFKEDIIGELNRMQAKAAEYRLAEKNYESAKRKKQQFEKENDIDNIMDISDCPYTLEELNHLIQEVDERSEDVREAIEQYNRQMENFQEILDLRDEKEVELQNALEIQEEENHKYDIYQATQNFLQVAKEQFTARYMAPIADGFRKYYEIITQDTNGNWQVDANINVKVKEQGEYRDVQWLSVGYRDLIGVCMRLALVDAMYPEEKPFLILDDPFVNLDDDKMKQSKQLLIALEKDYQAIYFTCHESREYK